MQDAFAVLPVDTTAAGDTFCGVLVAALDPGTSMARALRWANAAGAWPLHQAWRAIEHSDVR